MFFGKDLLPMPSEFAIDVLYSMNLTSALTVRARFDQISQLTVIGTTHHHCVYFCVRKSRLHDGLDTRDDLIIGYYDLSLWRSGLQRIGLAVMRFMPAAFRPSTRSARRTPFVVIAKSSQTNFADLCAMSAISVNLADQQFATGDSELYGKENTSIASLTG